MRTVFVIFLCSILETALAYLIFRNVPESWLQDYHYDPSVTPPAKRMHLFPDGLFLVCILWSLNQVAVGQMSAFQEHLNTWKMLSILLPIFPLILISFADFKNRIIPDQFVVVAALFSIPGFLADVTAGTLWGIDSLWYCAGLYRIIGAITASLILFGVAVGSAYFFRQEGMGLGDVKLIAACGLITGNYGIIFTFFFAFLTAGMVAIILLLCKHKNPKADRCMVFGPFLAAGTILFLINEPFLYLIYVQNIIGI